MRADRTLSFYLSSCQLPASSRHIFLRMAAQNLALDSFWVDRSVYSAAEQSFYERLGHEQLTPLVAEFVKARETIKEMKRQANEAAEVVGDGLHVKETKHDGSGKPSKKQKQKAAAKDQQAKSAKSADAAKSSQITSERSDNKSKTPNETVETPETESSALILSQTAEHIETPKSEEPAEGPENECKTPKKSVETSESQKIVSTPSQAPEIVEIPKSPKVPSDTLGNECNTSNELVETHESKNTTPPPPKTPEKIETSAQPEAMKEKEAEVRKQEKHPEKSASPPTKDKADVGCNVPAMDCEPVKFLEKKMLAFTDMMAKVQSQLEAMDARLSTIELRFGGVPAIAVCPAKPAAKPVAAADDDDDVDLFGSESEDDEAAAKIKEERLAAYNAKKSKKPALVAKSSIILDVKPWDDETDMQAMEAAVRAVACDGLLWGASKLVPLAYGIKKLQINCVVEDEKVSVDWLQEQIEANEDHVQSVDIAAFNKI